MTNIFKKNIYIILSVAALIFSLTQKTYCIDGNCGNYGDGFYSFFLGFIGILGGGAYLSWFANFFLVAAWIYYPKTKTVSFVLSGIGLCVALNFMTFETIMKNEAGHYGDITDYALGYYFWLASFVIITLGNIVGIFRRAKEVKFKH